MNFEPMSHWHGMPLFEQIKKSEYRLIMIDVESTGQSIFCRFRNADDVEDFAKILETEISVNTDRISVPDIYFLKFRLKQKITEKTKSIWHPVLIRGEDNNFVWKSTENHYPRYPIYIVSKNRSKNGITWRSLSLCGIDDYYVVVEESQFDAYSKVLPSERLLILPQSYLDNYDTCDDLGDSKSRGPGAARNFCIDHSKENGYKRHWVLDDNIDGFYRLHENKKIHFRCPTPFVACEDFVDRYENVPVSGMNYFHFAKKTAALAPFIKNTRIYSCLLIENDSGYRWRGRYNEDTDLSLRVLKDGLCTIQFNAFLCGKITTQRKRGGNSEEFYDKEGTYNKSKMLVDLHPDVAKFCKVFNRDHHHVNYRSFAKNELIMKENITTRDYGLYEHQD